MTTITKRLRWVRAILGALVAGLITAWITYRVWLDWGTVVDYHTQWHFGYLLASLTFQAPGWLLLVYNWGLIIGRLGGKTSFRAHLKTYAYSNLARSLPGRVWFIVGRVYLYEQQGVSKVVTSTGSVLEWLLVGIAASCLYLLSVLFHRSTSLPLSWFVLLVALGGIFFHPVIFNPVVNWVMRRFHQEGQHAIQVRFGDTLLWLALDAIVVAFGGFALFFVINAIFPVSMTHLAVATGAWSLSVAVSNLLFWLPGSLVLREGAMALALASVFPTPIAVLITIVWRVWLTILDLCWAALATRL